MQTSLDDHKHFLYTLKHNFLLFKKMTMGRMSTLSTNIKTMPKQTELLAYIQDTVWLPLMHIHVHCTCIQKHTYAHRDKCT